MPLKKQNQKPQDEVDLYYRLRKDIEDQEREKNEELQKLLLRLTDENHFLKEELIEVKSQNQSLKEFQRLAPLTGVLNLLNLKQDPVLDSLVREIVREGLMAFSPPISNFKLP